MTLKDTQILEAGNNYQTIHFDYYSPKIFPKRIPSLTNSNVLQLLNALAKFHVKSARSTKFFVFGISLTNSFLHHSIDLSLDTNRSQKNTRLMRQEGMEPSPFHDPLASR